MLLLFALLTGGPGFGQSLATVGENDALGASVGYAASSIHKGPVLSLGISGEKLFEIVGQIAWLGEESKPASFAVGVFPRSGKQSGGLGVAGGISIDLEKRRSDPVLNLGGLFYVKGESSKTYVLAGAGVFINKVLGSSGGVGTFGSVAFGIEFGLFSDKKASPFISLSGAAAEGGVATAVALSLGFRLPIPTEKKVKVTPGLPNQFD